MTTSTENLIGVPSIHQVPSPEIVARATRRKFTVEDQERILAEIDRCKRGEIGAILRREGIYSHTVTQWRAKRRAGLAAATRGPKPDGDLALRKENERLERKIQRLEHRLAQTEKVIEIQKKVSEILGVTFPEMDAPRMHA